MKRSRKIVRPLHEVEDGRDLGPVIRRITVRDAEGKVLRLPSAGPAEWTEPEDKFTTAKPPVVRGARALTGLDHLAAHRSDITADHLAAARRFALTVEAMMSAGYGSSARLPNGLPPGISSAAIGPADRALGAVASYCAAVAAMGAAGSRLVTRIVIDGDSIGKVAADTEVYHPVMVGMLIAALTRLVEHYWPHGREDQHA